MKILLANRKKEWEGGDYMKMELFHKSLNLLKGVSADIAAPGDLVDYKKYDLIHVFNLNFDWSYFFYQKAKQFNKPLVVSTIHFNGGSLSKNKQKEIFDYAHKIYFSTKEMEAVHNFLKTSKIDRNFSILLNGVNTPFHKKKNYENREIDLLMVMNLIHSRKNIMMGCKVAENLHKELTLIGRFYEPFKLYFETCRMQHPHLKWHNKRFNHMELNGIYNDTKIVLALGIEDPYPNTIPEGVKCGCHVIYSTETYCTLDSSKNAYSVSPFDMEQISNQVKDIIKKEPKDTEWYSYNEQAEKLKLIYKEVLS